MKHYIVGSLLAILFVASVAVGGSITPEMIARKPDVHCNVHKAPNPVFLGGWMVKPDKNTSVEFQLVKDGDGYGFFLFLQDDKRYKKSPYAKWRKMEIFGDAIVTGGGNIQFVTKKGKVFYQYRGGKPLEMKKVALETATSTKK